MRGADSSTKLPTLPTLDVQTDIKYYGTRARTILKVAQEIVRRLTGTFLRDANGHRPYIRKKDRHAR